ncbi:MAG: hypothetical protein GXY76_00085 [Chloroflexi bacterium]|nr:hypothetical protein [Chloroflexota bacterium]
MPRPSLRGQVPLLILFAVAAVVALYPLALSLSHASTYGLFRVPIASWVVLGLSALLLALDGAAIHAWWLGRKGRAALVETGQALDQATRELAALKADLLSDQLPAISGQEHLGRVEYGAILQALFRAVPDAGYIRVEPLSGGYSGNATVLATLGDRLGQRMLPRPFVVKLGDRREMAGEKDKYAEFVLPALSRKPGIVGYAEWGDLAGIAYEFASQGRHAQVQSLHQFYQGHAPAEVVKLIGESLAYLGEAWYQAGAAAEADLYQEYDLLHQKRQPIIEAAWRILEPGDGYSGELAAAEGDLRPLLRPAFCPDPELPWYDPIAFLRTWRRRSLTTDIHRSVVHGDLNARNILVETDQAGERRVWFIDFSHTGNGLSQQRTAEAMDKGVPVEQRRGHTLRDFARLEAECKFMLTRLNHEKDLRVAVAFERALLAAGLTLPAAPELPAAVLPLFDERFERLWQAIGEIRRRAAHYLIQEGDLRPYWMSLVQATLPVLYYQSAQFASEASERQQKRYALLAAGMLCARL